MHMLPSHTEIGVTFIQWSKTRHFHHGFYGRNEPQNLLFPNKRGPNNEMDGVAASKAPHFGSWMRDLGTYQRRLKISVGPGANRLHEAFFCHNFKKGHQNWQRSSNLPRGCLKRWGSCHYGSLVDCCHYGSKVRSNYAEGQMSTIRDFLSFGAKLSLQLILLLVSMSNIFGSL